MDEEIVTPIEEGAAAEEVAETPELMEEAAEEDAIEEDTGAIA